MKEGSNLFWGRFFRHLTDFMFPDGSAKLPTFFGEEMAHEPRDDHSTIRHVVYQVVGDTILAALPDHNARRMQIDSAHVMDVVVEDQIVSIDILGSRAVTAQQDACATHVLDMVPSDFVFLSVQIDTDRTAAAMGKMTIFDHTVLSAAQTNQRIGLVVHIPVVLQVLRRLRSIDNARRA